MRLSQIATIASLTTAGALASCGSERPTLEEGGGIQQLATSSPSASMQSIERSARSSAPIVVSAALDAAGRIEIEAGDVTLRFIASQCTNWSDTIDTCNNGVELNVSKADGSVNQVLKPEVVYLNSVETLYRGHLDESRKSEWYSFVLADVNDDGEDDLLIWTGKDGGYGGASYDVYLFDLASNELVYSQGFSDLTIATTGLFSIRDGKLLTAAADGCCTHYFSTFEVRSNEPVLVEQVTQVSSPNGSRVEKVERLIDGKLRDIKK